VHGGPYEYSPPGVPGDYLPQNEPRTPHMAVAH
jgi:hypothetical protein